MALNKHERKERLGYGGLLRIAKRTRRTLGHVSQVNSETRRDAVVERAIAKEIERRSGMPVAEVWPAEYTAEPPAQAAVA